MNTNTSLLYKLVRYHVAVKYPTLQKIDKEDLVQEAITAAWLLMPDYDPEKGSLLAFLLPKISFVCQRYMENQASPVRIPVYKQRIMARLAEHENDLTNLLMRKPTRAEFREYMDMDGSFIDEYYSGEFSDRVEDYDLPEENDTAKFFGLTEPEMAVYEEELNDAMEELLSGLTEDEQTILIEYFGIDGSESVSQRRLAMKLGISQPHVHRELKRLLSEARVRIDGPAE